MGNETLSDIFAAMATRDPYYGRKVRMGERELDIRQQLGMGNLGIANRGMNLQEMMAPGQMDLMEVQTQGLARGLYQDMQMGPVTLAGAKADLASKESIAKLIKGALDGIDDAHTRRQSGLMDLIDNAKDMIDKGGASVWEYLQGASPQSKLPSLDFNFDSMGDLAGQSTGTSADIPYSPLLAPIKAYEERTIAAQAKAAESVAVESKKEAATSLQYLRDFMAAEPDIARAVLEKAGIRTEADLAKLTPKQLRELRMNAIQRRNLQSDFRSGVLR